MWGFIGIVAAFSILMALSIEMVRRQKRRIREFFQSTGSVVRLMKPTLKNRAEYIVVFESNLNELRRAIVRVRHGLVEVIDDQPYHRTLTPPLPPQPKTVSLDQIVWLAEQSKLPGKSEYAQIMRGLVTGPHEIKIAESEKRFRSILQCIEMQAMATDDPESGILDLNIDRHSALVTWRVDGTSPNRVLMIRCELK